MTASLASPVVRTEKQAPLERDAPRNPRPTLGGVFGHPPPAFERNDEVQTRLAQLRAGFAPIVPQPTSEAP